MKPVRELRKKVAARAEKKAQVYSTSEARANFAEALETAQLENAVIGFDRYGRPVAALVSIDAVRMLAGRGHEVDPTIQDKISRLANIFLYSLPASKTVEPKAPPKPARATRPAKKAPAPKKKVVASKKKAPAKAKRRRKTMGKGP